MRTLAQRSTLNLSATLGLLVLAAWTATPARAADQRVAAIARPCASAQGTVCMSDVANVSLGANVRSAKPAAKPAAAPAMPAAKASRQGNYERDLWRHQGVG